MLGKSFAGLDVSCGAASAVAEISRAMSGAGVFTPGLGKSFIPFDVGLGSSSVAEMSRAMAGTSALAAGLGTSSAAAALLKTTGSTWSTGLGKSFAGLDVSRGAASALADISRVMRGTSALTAGLGTSSAAAAMLKTTGSTWSTELGKSFAGLDVSRGANRALVDMVKAMSGSSAASGLAEVVERLTPALDEGLDEQQRTAFRIYAATMLVCTGTHLLLTYPTAAAIALTALAIVQVSWWLATGGARRLP